MPPLLCRDSRLARDFASSSTILQWPCAAAADVIEWPSSVWELGSPPAARSARAHSWWPERKRWMLCVTRHTSRVMRNTSNVTRHTSHTSTTHLPPPPAPEPLHRQRLPTHWHWPPTARAQLAAAGAGITNDCKHTNQQQLSQASPSHVTPTHAPPHVTPTHAPPHPPCSLSPPASAASHPSPAAAPCQPSLARHVPAAL